MHRRPSRYELTIAEMTAKRLSKDAKTDGSIVLSKISALCRRDFLLKL